MPQQKTPYDRTKYKHEEEPLLDIGWARIRFGSDWIEIQVGLNERPILYTGRSGKPNHRVVIARHSQVLVAGAESLVERERQAIP
jgi:hypothetical protein